VCFSDGLSEAMNTRGEIWRESEIETILREDQKLSVKKVIERLDAFAGPVDQADDMSIVALRVR
jgi:serine phosphatase RsbU (regulator of sigma subunit)